MRAFILLLVACLFAGCGFTDDVQRSADRQEREDAAKEHSEQKQDSDRENARDIVIESAYEWSLRADDGSVRRCFSNKPASSFHNSGYFSFYCDPPETAGTRDEF